MTEDEQQELSDNFDTSWLLESMDELNRARSTLANPEIRQDLDKLHTMAMAVVNNGDVDQADEMFELADNIDYEISEIIDALENIQETMNKLTKLHSEDVEEGECTILV